MYFLLISYGLSGFGLYSQLRNSGLGELRDRKVVSECLGTWVGTFLTKLLTWG